MCFAEDAKGIFLLLKAYNGKIFYYNYYHDIGNSFSVIHAFRDYISFINFHPSLKS